MSSAVEREMARMRAERALKANGKAQKYVTKGEAKKKGGEDAAGEDARERDDADANGTTCEGAKRAREGEGDEDGDYGRVIRVVKVGKGAIGLEEETRASVAEKEEDAKTEALSAEETIRRLRSLGEPGTMFGETREDRILRLKVAEKNIAVADETTVTATQANEKLFDEERVREFAQKKKDRAKEEADKGKAKEGAGAPSDGANAEKALSAEEQELMDSFAAAAAKVKKEREQEAMEPIDQVAAYLKALVQEWEEELDQKSEEWCYTTEGRQMISTFKTTQQHLKPLFKRIKRRTLPGDVERVLYLIMQAMKARNYKKAADAYIGIAIGNAAWPIGVTMVGIHARSAREKIGAQSQAHAMHDEETRKYLQSIKRLMTYAQRAYPTTPSLSIDFNSGVNGSDKAELLKAEARLPIDRQVPALMLGDIDRHQADGWRAQDSDTRTWKSMLTHAYGERGRDAKITTAKDEVVNRDTSLYSTRAGYIRSNVKKNAADDQ